MCPPTVAVTDVLASQSNLSQPFLPAVTQTRQQLPPSSCTGVTEVYVMITYFKLNLKQVDQKNPISPTFSCRGQSSPSETVRCRVDDNYFRWNKKAKWKQKLKQIHPFLVVVVRNPVTEAQCVNMGYNWSPDFTCNVIAGFCRWPKPELHQRPTSPSFSYCAVKHLRHLLVIS